MAVTVVKDKDEESFEKYTKDLTTTGDSMIYVISVPTTSTEDRTYTFHGTYNHSIAGTLVSNLVTIKSEKTKTSTPLPDSEKNWLLSRDIADLNLSNHGTIHGVNVKGLVNELVDQKIPNITDGMQFKLYVKTIDNDTVDGGYSKISSIRWKIEIESLGYESDWTKLYNYGVSDWMDGELEGKTVSDFTVSLGLKKPTYDCYERRAVQFSNMTLKPEDGEKENWSWFNVDSDTIEVLTISVGFYYGTPILVDAIYGEVRPYYSLYLAYNYIEFYNIPRGEYILKYIDEDGNLLNNVMDIGKVSI